MVAGQQGEDIQHTETTTYRRLLGGGDHSQNWTPGRSGLGVLRDGGGHKDGG